MRNRFNGHLRKKGISGQIKISYEDETLSIEVFVVDDVITGFRYYYLGYWPGITPITFCQCTFFQVKMPQDASNNTVRDTRGLSGTLLIYLIQNIRYSYVLSISYLHFNLQTPPVVNIRKQVSFLLFG